MEQPEMLRILRSLSVALPLTDDPWAALCHGFRHGGEDVLSLIDRMNGEGWILGAWGEPNPIVAGMQPRLLSTSSAPRPDPATRWSGLRPTGGWLVNQHHPTARGEAPPPQWFKVGLPLHFAQTATELLQPDTDRTTMADGHMIPKPSIAPSETRIQQLLRSPIPLNPRLPFWPQIAEPLAVEPAEAMAAIRALLMARAIRRFAVRVDLFAAGWKGCGIAAWRLDPAQAPDAAKALAATMGTGDVTLGPEPGLIRALFLARPVGLGHEAALSIARQWNLPLDGFTALEIH